MPALSRAPVNRVIVDNNNEAAHLIETEDFQGAIAKLLFARNTLEQFLTSSQGQAVGSGTDTGAREDDNDNPLLSILDCDDLFTDIYGGRENGRYRVFRRAIRLPATWEIAIEHEKMVTAVVCMFNTGKRTMSAAISCVLFPFDCNAINPIQFMCDLTMTISTFIRNLIYHPRSACVSSTCNGEPSR